MSQEGSNKGIDGGLWDNRPKWSRHIEFVITCVGSAVGLGNVWRFPHLVYSNGGGVFLIPYTISLFLIGIPLMCLEIFFGQFSSRGPVAAWEINPMFKGLGYSLTLCSALICIFYNVIISIAIYFLFASMTSTLPWKTCGNRWNTCACRTNQMNWTLPDPEVWIKSNGLNCTNANLQPKDRKSATEEYYYNEVLQLTSGIDDAGMIKWDLTLCNFFVWILVCLCLIKGVKSIGKVAYFFTLSPYTLLLVLVIRGLTLEGSASGIAFYLTPDLRPLAEARVWKTAASQIMFSLSCANGIMIAMSSYNNFRYNFLMDSFIISIINCSTSFFAGFAIFSVLGFMSKISGKSIHTVTTSGPGVVFVAYPEALGELPFPQLWSILFFTMVFFLGMSSQYTLVETVLTAIQDEFPLLRAKNFNYITRACVCFGFFLLGLPQTTQGGFYVLDVTNTFLDLPLLVVALGEFITIAWIYGIERLTEDVFLMIGKSTRNLRLFYWYFKWNMLYVSPLILAFIIIFEFFTYKSIVSDTLPMWTEALGWLQIVFVLMWIPIIFFYRLCTTVSGTVFSWALLKELSQPTDNWGPSLDENRVGSRYEKIQKSSTSESKKSEELGVEGEQPHGITESEGDNLPTVDGNGKSLPRLSTEV